MKLFKLVILSFILSGCATEAHINIPRGCDVINISRSTVTISCPDGLEVNSVGASDHTHRD